MSKIVILVCAFIFTIGIFDGSCKAANMRDANSIADVKAGKLTTANAAWWGFNEADATEALQGAIYSGAKEVVVPYMAKPWVIRAVAFKSNQKVFFEPGVEIIAKEGEFKGKWDCLFTLKDLENVEISGYGAQIKMRKSEYTEQNGYVKSEWRHGFNVSRCKNVRIAGLTVSSTGGDGIIIGAAKYDENPYSTDVVIKDVRCDDNHRQGISVIGAVNLLIENCVLENTRGTAPSAGLDVEPSNPKQLIVNCVIRNCISRNNDGTGFIVYMGHSEKKNDMSVLFENCLTEANKGFGLSVGALKDDGSGGEIKFVNCVVRDNVGAGVYVYDKSVDAAKVKFINCSFKDVALGESGASPEAVNPSENKLDAAPIHIYLRRDSFTKKHGGVEFDSCYVHDSKDRPFLVVSELQGKNYGVSNIKGTFYVSGPSDKYNLGTNNSNVDIKVVPLGANVPK